MALHCTLRLGVKRGTLSAPTGEAGFIRSANKFSRIFVYSLRFAY
jgi:hypothetical protein